MPLRNASATLQGNVSRYKRVAISVAARPKTHADNRIIFLLTA